MAAGDKIIGLLLRVQTDEAARKKAEKALVGLRELLDDTAKATITNEQAMSKLNREMAEIARVRAIDELSAQARRAIDEGEDLVDVLQRVSQELSDIGASDGEIRRVADALTDVRRNADGGIQVSSGLETSRQAIGDFSSTFGAASSVLGGNAGLSTIGDTLGLVEYLPLAAQGFAALSPVMLGIVGITGLATAAYSEMQAAQERAREEVRQTVSELQRETEARQALRGAIAGGDPGAIQAQIAGLRADARTIAEEELNPLRNARNERVLELLRGAEEVAASRGQTLTPQQLRGIVDTAAASDPRVQEFDAQIALVQERIGGLNDTIEELSTLGVQGAEALQQLNRPLREAQQARQLAASGTVAQVNAEIAALTEDISLYTQQIGDAEGMIAEARRNGNAALADQLEIFVAETEAARTGAEANREFLQTQGLVIAGTREHRQALEELRSALAEAWEELTARRDDMRTAVNQRQLDAATKLVQLRERETQIIEEINAAQREALDKRREIDREVERARNEILAESGEERTRIEERSRDALLKIQRELTRSYGKAVAERDALAAHQAQEAAKDRREDQALEDKRALEALARNEEKKLDALAKSHSKQLDQLVQAANREIAARTAALTRIQVDLINATNAEIAHRNSRTSQLLAIDVYLWSEMINIARQRAADLLTEWYNGLAPAGGAGARSRGGGGGARYTPFSVERVVDQRLNTYFRRSGLIPG